LQFIPLLVKAAPTGSNSSGHELIGQNIYQQAMKVSTQKAILKSPESFQP